MKIWIITLFPQYFSSFMDLGIIGSVLKGKRGAQFEVIPVSLREFSPNDYKGVDDSPFGGGPGMVIRADVLKAALMGIVERGSYGENFKDKLHVIYPSPRGRVWENSFCKEFAGEHFGQSSKDLVFICGRYEGIDERFIEKYVDLEISLGDFILTGGELATMVILDSTLRFVSGVLGNKESAQFESFQNQKLEGPQYTRPREFEGLEVPSILLSGNHGEISKYQENERIRVTEKFRPDLVGDKS
jgi:tRNA (guanine37-N1)-methyltransferase